MKRFLSILIVSIFLLSGCSITDSSITGTQPKGVKYYKQEERLFDIKAQRIIFEAPMKTTTDSKGNTITEPIMRTESVTSNGVTTVTQEPILAEFWTKDTGAKPPTTWLDVVNKGLGLGVIYGLGGKALTVIQGMSELTAKEPMVVQPSYPPKSDIITSNPDGSFNVDRGQ